MSRLSALYEAVFKRLRGKGFGLGLFNRFHKTVYEGWLQPPSIEVNGFRLFLPVHDEGVADNLRMERAWEPQMTREFERVVGAGMTVLDLGANIGYHTVLASRLVGPRGRVLSFEPDPGNLALLKKNIEANGCANVEVFPHAVGDRAGTVDLHLCGSNTGAHSTAYEPGGSPAATRVRMVRLDDFLKADLHPDVVKMDIEGGEGAALDGMTRLLEDPRLRFVFIECNAAILAKIGGSVDGLLERLRRRGFKDRRLDDLNVLCAR